MCLPSQSDILTLNHLHLLEHSHAQPVTKKTKIITLFKSKFDKQGMAWEHIIEKETKQL